MYALLSVSDKTGVLELARRLHQRGVKLLSTGGTARLLADAGLPVTEVASHTGFPEMLDGRVKTLHPKVHGGLLARRDLPEHMAAIEQHGIAPIDWLVVNLYPFEATVARPGCTLEEAIENIDIGGPAMVRSAAKNWQGVSVLTDASQYEAVLAEFESTGQVSQATRFALSVAAFNRVAQYDAAISNHLSALSLDAGSPQARPAAQEWPGQFNLSLVKLQDLRYGENPHQSAAFYRDLQPLPGSLPLARQLQGKELSYNNIADADAAWECVRAFDTCACVIVKHANPCGAALGADPEAAYRAAFATDPTSAFGGIIAFNREVDEAAARAVTGQFVEVLIAPSYTAQALQLLAAKVNVRVLAIELPPAGAPVPRRLDAKRVNSGLLLQTADDDLLDETALKVVTRRAPTDAEMADLHFAWKVAKFTKSNAIVFAAGGRTIGVGAGQMSRVDSTRIATIKAANAGLQVAGSVVASDAFFPFRDGIDVLAQAGARAVIHPGGSMRDQEVIAAADEHGLAMVLTGMRHFRH